METGAVSVHDTSPHERSWIEGGHVKTPIMATSVGWDHLAREAALIRERNAEYLQSDLTRTQTLDERQQCLVIDQWTYAASHFGLGAVPVPRIQAIEAYEASAALAPADSSSEKAL